MSDDQDGCVWVSVFSRTGLPGLSRTKGRETVVYVCFSFSRDDRRVVAGRTLFTTRPSTVMLQLHGFIVQHVHTVMGA